MAGTAGDLFAWLGLAAIGMATVLGLLEATFGFTVGWLLVLGLGIPAILFVMPAVIGAALLVQ